mmetsp:Transcript_7902/g.8712  ORF Transcript_7902/g.8712 Transcript_7902/m.8712 type:complete len:778 (+) Transcript_7902:100-2433(+)
MGGKLSTCKCTKDNGSIIPPSIATQREGMATWYRTSIAVTDVYEIIKTVGQGRMGEVYHVRRKDGGRTHTEESKLKRNESTHSFFGDDLDTSVGSSRSLGGRSRGRTPRRDSPVRARSLSPFSGSKQKRRAIAKKNAEMLQSHGIEISVKKEEKKSEPDHATAPKPIPILKNASRGGVSRSDGTQSHGDTGNCSLKGMTALITGMLDNDDDDEEVSLNINAQDPVQVKATSVESNHSDGSEDQDESPHAHFLDREISDDNSLVSEVTYTEDPIEVCIVTGDGTQLKKNEKKWVPRRRVFFRRHYACKTIATGNIKTEDMRELMNEIYMMRKMDHPYIIRLYEVYQVQKKIWLVMDLCNGGDLRSRRLNEHQVTIVTEKILRGVAYLHRRGICHRDLKLENILYENKKEDSPIRLIDFGLSLTYDVIDTKKKYQGAAYTLSPEVLIKKPYTGKSDVWSIGIMIWVLLSGDYPFIKSYDDLKNESLRKNLEQANYNFGITWRGRGITEDAKEFVKGCLRREPEKRWTALEALEFLQDKWIPRLEEKAKKDAELDARIFPKKEPSRLKHMDSMKKLKYTKGSLPPVSSITSMRRKNKFEIFDNDVLDDMKRFAQYSLFKKTIFVTMANTMDHKDVGRLQEIFVMIDTNHSGTISLPELQKALHKSDSNDLDDNTIKDIFDAIDYDRSGEVHYAEFLAAFSENQGLITVDRLADTFDRIDSQGKGYITHEDLQILLGGNYSIEMVDNMIEEGDFKKNGQVDFDEFLQFMIGETEVSGEVKS